MFFLGKFFMLRTQIKDGLLPTMISLSIFSPCLVQPSLCVSPMVPPFQYGHPSPEKSTENPRSGSLPTEIFSLPMAPVPWFGNRTLPISVFPTLLLRIQAISS
uniref:Uncharacterized protein n=1 Tax=Opuntia streptacantha TaxID=393608 RepID=A0A7C9E039_OPUST